MRCDFRFGVEKTRRGDNAPGGGGEDEQEEAPEQPAATKNGYLECSSSSCRAQRLKHGVGSVRDACPPTKIFTLPPRLPRTD